MESFDKKNWRVVEWLCCKSLRQMTCKTPASRAYEQISLGLSKQPLSENISNPLLRNFSPLNSRILRRLLESIAIKTNRWYKTLYIWHRSCTPSLPTTPYSHTLWPTGMSFLMHTHRTSSLCSADWTTSTWKTKRTLNLFEMLWWAFFQSTKDDLKAWQGRRSQG